MKSRHIVFASLFFCFSANAKKILVKDPNERQDYIKHAKSWLGAEWIDSDLNFDDTKLDILNGPKIRGRLKSAYKQNFIECQTTPELLDSANSGNTEKFFCYYMEYNPIYDSSSLALDKNGKPVKIKVKYGADNGEIYAEVIATRLLWALGFPVDAVYHIDELACYGCSKDPFKNRSLDMNTIFEARIFPHSAIEQKFKGDEILYAGKQPRRARRPGARGVSSYERVKKIPREGWSFTELNKLVSKDKEERLSQRTHRDALRLLLAMISHADSKPANHRLVCQNNKIDENGKCIGNTYLVAQDLGVTFGGLNLGSVLGDLITFNNPLSRVNYDRWKDQKVWLSKKKCKPRVGFNIAGGNFSDPISEEGRSFLYKLLKKFTHGEAGYQRIVNVFKAGRVNLRSADAKLWADRFIERIEEIMIPTSCPKAK